MYPLMFRGIGFVLILAVWVATMMHTKHPFQTPSSATLWLTIVLILLVWEFGLHMALTYGHGRKSSE